ncbi:hypothetical protein HDU98_000178 [Podochytrium sp. JEL0797]|nr:hypothetical protein HDU98_000178 [Podochytrium sp. JEL0797]
MTIYADVALANGTMGMDLVTDEMIVHLAQRMNNIITETGRKVMMRWLPEMNGSWMLYGMRPAQYVSLWMRMGPIMRQYAPKVIIVWSPNFDLRPGDNYWPGTQYVDMIGTSVYFKGWGVNSAIPHGYASGSWDYVYKTYAAPNNLPFVISEASAAWESGPGTSPVTGAFFPNVTNEVSQATFQSQFWAGIMSADIFAQYPLLTGAYLFEVAKQEEFFSDFRVEADPAVLAAFKEVIKSVDQAGYMQWATVNPATATKTATAIQVASSSQAPSLESVVVTTKKSGSRGVGPCLATGLMTSSLFGLIF